jgi:hypothetical protein
MTKKISPPNFLVNESMKSLSTFELISRTFESWLTQMAFARYQSAFSVCSMTHSISAEGRRPTFGLATSVQPSGQPPHSQNPAKEAKTKT